MGKNIKKINKYFLDWNFWNMKTGSVCVYMHWTGSEYIQLLEMCTCVCVCVCVCACVCVKQDRLEMEGRLKKRWMVGG